MENFADNVMKLCLEKYQSLKKTGKPSECEWTVLSGIVIKKADGLSLASLATGTKCLGGNDLMNTALYERGCRLSDSHAEVLARRAFVRYLYEQIDFVLGDNKSDIFILDDKKQIKIKENISFHFFTSQVPCGDCSIFPKEYIYDTLSPPIKIRKITDENDTILGKLYWERNQITKDICRTGAKCLKDEKKQDPHLPGVDYHVVGPLRTKPGRGDPTMSLSCSDKMAKWNFLGIQGALLSLLIPQIKISSIIVGSSCPFSKEAMERGLYKRFDKNIQPVLILQARHIFPHSKSSSRLHPCPTSIIWCAVQKREVEIAVEGRKQGATKKKKGDYLLVTQKAFLKSFLNIYNKYKLLNHELRHPKKLTYHDCKQMSVNYYKLWNRLKSDIFPTWPTKPYSLQKFVL